LLAAISGPISRKRLFQRRLIKSGKFSNIWEVFCYRRIFRFAKTDGAPCTTEMKIVPRKRYASAIDNHVFGFCADEKKRIDKFHKNFPDLFPLWILQDEKIIKTDCY
jgi:hypothetical protein